MIKPPGPRNGFQGRNTPAERRAFFDLDRRLISTGALEARLADAEARLAAAEARLDALEAP